MKQAYSIYEAKAKFSEIIRAVKQKKRIVVTERGVPVATVVPYQPANQESMEERLRRLGESGTVIRSRKRFLAQPVQVIPGASDRFLSEDRQE
jgi:prevent-host-death family protein